MSRKKIIIPLILVFFAMVACAVFLVWGVAEEKEGDNTNEVSVFENYNYIKDSDNEYSYVVTARNCTNKGYYVRVKFDTSIKDKEEEKDFINKYLNKEDWDYDEDGYIYLKEKLSGGETSNPVLKGVISNDSSIVKDTDVSICVSDSGYVKSKIGGSYKKAFSDFKDE